MLPAYWTSSYKSATFRPFRKYRSIAIYFWLLSDSHNFTHNFVTFSRMAHMKRYEQDLYTRINTFSPRIHIFLFISTSRLNLQKKIKHIAMDTPSLRFWVITTPWKCTRSTIKLHIFHLFYQKFDNLPSKLLHCFLFCSFYQLHLLGFYSLKPT